MKVTKVADAASSLGNPAAAAWGSVAKEEVALGAIALAAQPTAYIREAWTNKPYASTKAAKVSAATDGQRLYVRLEWADDAKPNGEFPDGAAAVFGSGAVATLGSREAPVDLWLWQQGRPEALSVQSSGPGVFKRHGSSGLGASEALEGGRWAVVLSGPAAAAASGNLGVAVWNGTNEERAGLGAVSQRWLTLELA